MPLPTPRKLQDSKAFIASCMSSKVMKREFPNYKQRLAVCFSRLRKARGKKTLPKK